MIRNEYEKEEDAVFGPDQPVEFESSANMITLDIPIEGLTVEDWKITPLVRPVVRIIACWFINETYIF